MSSKLQNLPATTSLASSDLVYVVTDPSGTPTDNKITFTNLQANATKVGKVTLTQPATGATLTIIDGKTLTVNKTISFTAADDTGVYTLPTGTKTLLATDGAGTSLTGIPYTLTGTANQVILSAGTGNITFSLPQSIATSSNPQFATLELGAASDTTLARVSAGVISVEGVRVITSSGTTSGTILKNNGTTFVASTETYAAPGSSGNVMTSDGTNWTSAAPAGGGSAPRIVRSWDFVVTPSTDIQSSNFYTVTGTGAVTNVSGGYQLTTGATNSSQVRMRFRQAWTGDDLLGWDQDPELIVIQTLSAATSGGAIAQYTLGDNGGESDSSGVLVDKHMGFLFCYSGGVLTVYASNANGSTQTKTDVTGSVNPGDSTILRATMDSGTNIKFYINGTLVATHTTNLPSGALSNTSTVYVDLDTGTTSTLTTQLQAWQFSANC